MPFDSIPDEPSRFQRILRRARALLARRMGWVQGAFVEDHISGDGDAYCMVGALNEARNKLGARRYTYDDQYDDEINALAVTLGFKRADDIPDWNDEDGRTKRAVLRRIDKALAKLDAGQTVR